MDGPEESIHYVGLERVSDPRGMRVRIRVCKGHIRICDGVSGRFWGDLRWSTNASYLAPLGDQEMDASLGILPPDER